MAELKGMDGRSLVALLNRKLQQHIDPERMYRVERMPALSYVRPARLDLMPKIAYAKAYLKGNVSSATEAKYLAHIDAINGFFEDDDSGKLGPQAFLEQFQVLLDSIRAHGFDSRFPVPTSDGQILDGGHRVAASVALGVAVESIEVPGIKAHDFSAQALIERRLPLHVVNEWISEYVRLSSTCRVIFVWPSARGKDAELQDAILKFGQVVAQKNLRLSARGRTNLVRLLYRNEPWIGSENDDYVGLNGKADMCFQGDGPIRIFVVDSVVDWLALKSEIRSIFGIGKHSVHINDTHQESIELVDCCIDDQGAVWLDSHLPRNFSWFNRLFGVYRNWINSDGRNPDNYCLVGSATLAAFGCRDVRDLDFVAAAGAVVDSGYKEIDCHNDEIAQYGVGVEELIDDSSKHFMFCGVKVASPDVLKRMKLIRGEEKDLEDVQLLDRVLSCAELKVVRRQRRMWSHVYLKGRVKLFALKCRFLMLQGAYRARALLRGA